MSEVIGVKHDGGKPWAGTVLAGFWPQLRVLFSEQLNLEAVLSDGDFQRLCAVLDAFFDVSLEIPDRFVKAADLLTDVDGEAYLPHVIDVGTYGARKYARDNWLHVKGGVERYYEAVGRHVRDVMLGDWRDEESGCVNLGHIAWGILAGAELVRREATAAKVKSDAVDALLIMIDSYSDEQLPFDEEDCALAGIPRPSLKLPLEVGKRYRLFVHGEEQGVYVAQDFSPVEKSCLINCWAFYVETGMAPGCESSLRLEGPVEP